MNPRPLWLVLGLLVSTLLARAEAPAAPMNVLTPAEKAAGWTLLFDGSSLAGWEPRGTARWEAAEGTIRYMPGTGPGFLCTTQDYADYELTVEFFPDATVNSGVFLRCPPGPAITAANAYEVNIYDPHVKWRTGSINEIVARRVELATVGKWNTYVIKAQGDHLVVTLNGEVTVDVHDGKHQRGVIGLQNSRGEGVIRFRNLKLRPLPKGN